MSEIVFMKIEGGRLSAFNQYGSRVWEDRTPMGGCEFEDAVRSVMADYAASRSSEVEALTMRTQAMGELMAKMAKRLDEIEGGDEWDKLNRLCWEPEQVNEEKEIPF